MEAKMGEHRFGFERLAVYGEARVLVRGVYATARDFPADERFGLTSQVTRAAVSIAANIAEGNSRRSLKEQAHFSEVAFGSLMEVLCLLDIAKEMGFIGDARMADFRSQIESISNKLNVLWRSQVQRSRKT